MEEESPAANRVCFNELGQMNDINVGQGSKDCSPDLMVSQNISLLFIHLNLNLNSANTVDKPQKGVLTC